MRQRRIFDKILQSQAVKDMSFDQMGAIADDELKQLLGLKDTEQREYERYSSGIRELLIGDCVLEQRQSELERVLDSLRLSGFSQADGALGPGSELILNVRGEMPQEEAQG